MTQFKIGDRVMVTRNNLNPRLMYGGYITGETELYWLTDVGVLVTKAGPHYAIDPAHVAVLED